MNLLLALILKDLRVFLTDRLAVSFSFLVPIMLASFLGSVTGGRPGKSSNTGIPVVVADLDGSAVSRMIVQKLSADPTLKITLTNETEVLNAVQEGRKSAGLVLPKGLSHDAPRSLLGLAPRPVVRVLQDPSREFVASALQGLVVQHSLAGFAEAVVDGTLVRELIAEALERVKPERERMESQMPPLKPLFVAAELWLALRTNPSTGDATKASAPKPTPAGTQLRLPFDIKLVSVTGPKSAPYNAYAHSFAGMGVQFVLMAAIDWGIGILNDRQRGLWKRYRTAPLSRWILLGSRAASNVVSAMASLVVGFGFSMLVFGVRVEGSWIGFAFALLATSCMAAGLGLFLASLGKTAAATRGMSIPAILVLVMLSGAWVPPFLFPSWLQDLTLLTPTRHAVDALDAVTWRGLGFDAVLLPIGVQFAAAAALVYLASRLFRWETD